MEAGAGNRYTELIVNERNWFPFAPLIFLCLLRRGFMLHSLLVGVTALCIGLVPAPRELNLDENKAFLVTHQSRVVLAQPVPESVRQGLTKLYTQLGYELEEVDAARYTPVEGSLLIGLAESHPAFQKGRVKKWARRCADLPPGGYGIQVTPKGMVLAGKDGAGLFWGLQTLIQIAGGREVTWPGMELLDWPALGVRGVRLSGLPTSNDLARFAALKCNWLLLESPDFLRLDGARADAWQKVFQEARQYHLEPVPLIAPLEDAGALLAQAPIAGEGRPWSEALSLHGGDWSVLSKRHALHTKQSPIRVTISGMTCREKEDYLVKAGALEAPFGEGGPLWMIRRVPGGKIPEGATITADYGYLPKNTAALCPSALESADVMAGVLKALHTTLQARFVHIGHGGAARLNSDPRCLAQGKTDAQVLRDSMALWAKLAEEHAPGAQVLAWGDFLPTLLSKGGSASWPGGVRLVHRGGDAPDSRLPAPWLFFAPNQGAAAYRSATSAVQRDAGGVVVDLPHQAGKALQAAMDKAWSPESSNALWPEALNAHFGAALWQPDHAQRMEALVAFLNRRMVQGGDPRELYDAFQTLKRSLSKTVPKDHPELTLVDGLMKNLTAYLDLEARYSAVAKPGLLREAAELAKAQSKLDPALDEARLARIVQTIGEQRLFVPASILFGTQLLYGRGTPPPAGFQAFEMPAEIQFQDEQGSVRAEWDWLGRAGPLWRVDFETVHGDMARLEGDGRLLGAWSTGVTGGLRGPVFVQKPQAASQFQFTVRRERGQAVLRELRLFVLKGAGDLDCPYTVEAPGLEAQSWPHPAQAIGFLRTDKRQFAEAPTEVRLCRTRSHLYVGVTAWEPKMHAMVGGIRSRDGDLWRQEAFALSLRRASGPRYRFVTNPAGGRQDAENGDAGWEGDWSVQYDRRDKAWRAVLALPFATLGGAPRSGETWGVNFERHRYNVEEEYSQWAESDRDAGRDAMGVLRFR
jgi:hypothetical protein